MNTLLYISQLASGGWKHFVLFYYSQIAVVF